MHFKVRENMNGFTIIAQADAVMMDRRCVVIMGTRTRKPTGSPTPPGTEYVVARVYENGAREWDNGRYTHNKVQAWQNFVTMCLGGFLHIEGHIEE